MRPLLHRRVCHEANALSIAHRHRCVSVSEADAHSPAPCAQLAVHPYLIHCRTSVDTLSKEVARQSSGPNDEPPPIIRDRAGDLKEVTSDRLCADVAPVPSLLLEVRLGPKSSSDVRQSLEADGG